eukprot:SAG31_NODE_40977_length_278_cov_0.826816_1_plen_33_part_10
MIHVRILLLVSSDYLTRYVLGVLGSLYAFRYVR